MEIIKIKKRERRKSVEKCVHLSMGVEGEGSMALDSQWRLQRQEQCPGTWTVINRVSQETPLDGSITALLFDLRRLYNSGFLKPLSLVLRSMIY